MAAGRSRLHPLWLGLASHPTAASSCGWLAAAASLPRCCWRVDGLVQIKPKVLQVSKLQRIQRVALLLQQAAVAGDVLRDPAEGARGRSSGRNNDSQRLLWHPSVEEAACTAATGHPSWDPAPQQWQERDCQRERRYSSTADREAHWFICSRSASYTHSSSFCSISTILQANMLVFKAQACTKCGGELRAAGQPARHMPPIPVCLLRRLLHCLPAIRAKQPLLQLLR